MNYVQQIDGGYRLTNSRVSLDSIVHGWLSGLSPESIVENFETLNLEQVYGAITFYLAHKAEVDTHLQRQKAKFEELTLKALSLPKSFAFGDNRVSPCKGDGD